MEKSQKFTALKDKVNQILGDKKYQEAIPVILEALDLSREIGASLENVSELEYALGYAKLNLGELEESRELLERSIKGFRSTGEHELINLAFALHDVGIIHREQKNNKKAFDYFSEELSIWKEVSSNTKLPPNLTLCMAECLYNCGFIMADSGEFGGARRNFEQVLELRQNFLSDNHPSIGETLLSLGAICFEIKEYANAAKYYEKGISLLEKSFGANNERISQAKDKLVFAQLKINENSETYN